MDGIHNCDHTSMCFLECGFYEVGNSFKNLPTSPWLCKGVFHCSVCVSANFSLAEFGMIKKSLVSDYCCGKGGKCCIEACWNSEWALIIEILETITWAMATQKNCSNWTEDWRLIKQFKPVQKYPSQLRWCGLYIPFFIGKEEVRVVIHLDSHKGLPPFHMTFS